MERKISRRQAARNLRRPSQAEGQKIKYYFALNFFFLIVSILLLTTFLNAQFMNRQIQREANQALVNEQAEAGATNFLTALGAEAPTDDDILTARQIKPLQTLIVNYVLQPHGFYDDYHDLAGEIQTSLMTNIDNTSTAEARALKTVLTKNADTAKYAIATGFELNLINVIGNLAMGAFVVALIVIVLTIGVTGYLIYRYAQEFALRRLIHELAQGLFLASALIIILGLIIALIPIFGSGSGWGWNVLQVASDILLEWVIIGALAAVVGIIASSATSAR